MTASALDAVALSVSYTLSPSASTISTDRIVLSDTGCMCSMLSSIHTSGARQNRGGVRFTPLAMSLCVRLTSMRVFGVVSNGIELPMEIDAKAMAAINIKREVFIFLSVFVGE